MNTLVIKSTTTFLIPLALGIVATFLYKNSIPEKNIISELKSGSISRSLGKVVQSEKTGSSLPYQLSQAEQDYISTLKDENKKIIAEGILLSRSPSEEEEKLNDLAQYIEMNQEESLNSIESILNDNVLNSPLDRASLIEALSKINLNPEKRLQIVTSELQKDVQLSETTNPDDIFYLTYIKKSSYEIFLAASSPENILKETQDILETQTDYNVQMGIKESLYNKYPELAKEIGITSETFKTEVTKNDK